MTNHLVQYLMLDCDTSTTVILTCMFSIATASVSIATVTACLWSADNISQKIYRINFFHLSGTALAHTGVCVVREEEQNLQNCPPYPQTSVCCFPDTCTLYAPESTVDPPPPPSPPSPTHSTHCVASQLVFSRRQELDQGCQVQYMYMY